MVDGAMDRFQFNVLSYRGLHPPNFFVALNRLPTLESYDYTNTSVSDGTGGYVWQWSQINPPSSTVYIGMFLYGTFGNAYVSGNWSYNYEIIPFNTVISRNLDNTRWCGQFTVTPENLSFNLQVSREEPGGYPIFYVAPGVSPTPSTAAYTLDTSQNSFSQVTVKKPFIPTGPNPGNWIICTQSSFTGAFYLQVTV